MSTKKDETIRLWKYIVKFNQSPNPAGVLKYDLSKLNLVYDFDKLEPYLDVFDDVPNEYKLDALEKFFGLLFVYLIDNRQMDIPMANKIVSKELYDQNAKDIKVVEDFLSLLEREKVHNIQPMKQELEKLVNGYKTVVEAKAVTKLQIKNLLLRMNKQFNLKKSFAIKQLTDII